MAEVGGGGPGDPSPKTVAQLGRFCGLGRGRLSLRGGVTRPSSRLAQLVLGFFVLSALVAGCGEEGVAEDAVLSVYVSEPLCAEARGALQEAGSKARDYRLRAVCVDDTRGAGIARLAAIGAAARRATEDSATIAYVGTTDVTAARFSKPILEEADIARISSPSGEAAVARLLRALRRTDDSGSLREALASALR